MQTCTNWYWKNNGHAWIMLKIKFRTLSFKSFKSVELKIKLWWVGACEIKKFSFFVMFNLSDVNFLIFVFFIDV